jgi:hypothetical protein
MIGPILFILVVGLIRYLAGGWVSETPDQRRDRYLKQEMRTYFERKNADFLFHRKD